MKAETVGKKLLAWEGGKKVVGEIGSWWKNDLKPRRIRRRSVKGNRTVDLRLTVLENLICGQVVGEEETQMQGVVMVKKKVSSSPILKGMVTDE